MKHLFMDARDLSYEEYMEQTEVAHRKIVIQVYENGSGYVYSQQEGDFILERGYIIPTSDRLINRLKDKLIK
jgi:hypothetical protein